MTHSRLKAGISRRTLLRGAALGASSIAATALVGCGDESDVTLAPSSTAGAATQPAISPTAAPEPFAWSRVSFSAGPAARRDHSLTYAGDDGGLIYLFGGRAKGVADNQFWTFDPRSVVWRQIEPAGPAPEPRFAHNASYDSMARRLIVTMGQGNGGTFFNDAWAFGEGRWSRLDSDSAERPEIRYGAGGAYDPSGDRILISHGFTDRGRFDDTWALNLTSGTWTKIATAGEVPIKRCLTRCVLDQRTNSLLMFGGQTDDNPFLGDLWELDLAKGVWTERTPAPHPGPRNLYGASVGEDDKSGSRRWYVTCGNTPDGPTGETWAFDPALGLWSRVGVADDAPPPRYSTDAAFASGSIYIFGGHNGQAEIDDMWALTPVP